MHDDIPDIHRRLDRFLESRVGPAMIGRRTELRVEGWETARHDVPFAEAVVAPFRPIQIGEPWGAPWSTVWFHLVGDLPTGHPFTELRVDPGFGPGPGFNAEGLVYASDGTIVKGLNPLNTSIPLEAVRVGNRVDLYIETAANPAIIGFEPTDRGDIRTAGSDPLYRFAAAELVERRSEVVELAADLDVLRGVAETLPEDSPRRHRIYRTVDRALDSLDHRDIAGTASDGRAVLAPLFEVPAGPSEHRVSAVGHAHIDSAWLWPLRETARKVARTVANVLALCEEDDSLVFAFSSAQQHAWLKESYPQLWERLRGAVAAGRVVPVGGMWVESDTVMPSGESMVRQFLQGKRFFLDEYGIETIEAWLPDSFGYSAALPQIIRKSGNRYFLSQKPSWNRTNRFPHHSFTWEGIDGSRVFAHLPPVATYTSELSILELRRAAHDYAEKAVGSRSLVPFGWGDGGGGPTREMLARAHRLHDLDGAPRVEIESPIAFFEAAESEIDEPAVWVGEIYMEAHRGTLTSQHAMKAGNRTVEALLFDAEVWCTAATVRCGSEYPALQLRDLWREALLLQFHDILPGSAIRWVHREAAVAYTRLNEALRTIIDRAQRELAGTGDVRLSLRSAPDSLGGAMARPAQGNPDAVTTVRRDHGDVVLSNAFVRVRIDAAGELASIVVLRDSRELIQAGRTANRLVVHADAPALWDAWDIDAPYARGIQSEQHLLDIRVEEHGVRIERRIGGSAVSQRISLADDSARIDIETEVDWREDERFLRAYFPLLLNVSESAAETQFGVVRRPIHENTTWTWAQFEVSAHRFVHLDESGFGVGIINDAVYGHSFDRRSSPSGVVTEVGLSLLRAPNNPDPTTDRGRHSFRYAIVVDADLTATTRAAFELQHECLEIEGEREVRPLVSVSPPNVVLSAMKLAEDGSGDLIVRAYEAVGRRTRATVAIDTPIDTVAQTDLLERPLDDRVAPGATVEVELAPFEIVTLRARRQLESIEQRKTE